MQLIEPPPSADSMDVHERITEWVLAIHRRNGGELVQLEPGWRLMEPALRIDSLDLAEIMVAVEREFGCAPFDAPRPPRTWGDLVVLISESRQRRGESRGQTA